jgi:hypothetical protein
VKKSISLTVLSGLLFAAGGFWSMPAAIADPGDTLWTRAYGGSYYDEAYCVDRTADGGYIVTGRTESFTPGNSDVWLLKTDADGDTLWARVYGGGDSDQGRSVQQTADGGFIVAGYIEDANLVANLYLIKTDAQGDSLWTWRYEGDDYAYIYSVQQTTDEGYILAGKTGPFLEDYDAWLVKTDPLGDTSWTRKYGGDDHQEAYAVRQTSDGGYVVTGQTGTCPDFDVYLWKTDADGETMWANTYGGSNYDRGYSVQQTTDGGYIIAGTTESFGAGYQDVYLIKTDADGNSLWTRVYGYYQEDYAYSVQQTADDGYVVAGYTQSARDLNVWLLRTNVDGDTLWTRTYGGGGIEIGYSVQRSTDGGFVIAGCTNSIGAGNNDVYLLKVEGEAPEPDIAISMIPDITPPIVLPAGSNFIYEGTLTNNTDEDLYTDVWIKACYIPNGTYHGPYKTYSDLLVPADSTMSYYPVRQHIYAYAAPADYYYIAYCGEWPENNIIDSTFFMVTVTPTDAIAEDHGWDVYGWGGDTPEIPVDLALHGNYPNPFNAETNINFDLPAETHVKLEVYNLMGQRVETLVDGNMPAGHNSVTWDASTASSGIYFYRLTTGEQVFTERMTLLK